MLFVGLTLSSVNLSDVARVMKRTDRGTASLYALLMVGTILEMGIRWGLLLRAAGIAASFPGAIAVAYTGAFFNQFSAGAAGGDIARALLVARDTDLKARAVATILLDRAIGLATLILMGLVTALVNAGDPAYRTPAAILGTMAGAIALGSIVYYNPLLRRSALGQKLKARMPKAVEDLDSVFRLVLQRPLLLLVCVAITAVGQAMVIVAIWGLGRAMDLPGVAMSQCFSLLPIIFVSMALPISIGGLGVGEQAFIQGFKTFGLPETEALGLALMFRIVGLAISLPGLVIFLLGRARTSHK